MKTISRLILLISLIALTAACGTEPEPTPTLTPVPSETPTPSITPSATPTSTPSTTPTVTPTPSPTATITPTPTAAPLSSQDIFKLVSPSVAYVETDVVSGSGILLVGGMILTNAHVVWPFKEVRVIFPDGSEFVDVPVTNWDLQADLAVLGPVDTDAPPVVLSEAQDLQIGSDVYLVGYPGEVDEYPQPAITRGLISRVRNWDPIGVTYYQTDATVGGGQSGGMLVTEFGEVIGVSSFRFSDAEFGLVASARDVIPRVKGLLAGEDVDGLHDRTIPDEGGSFAHRALEIDHEWDSATFILNESPGTEVVITAKGGRNDVGLRIQDVFGNIIAETNERFEGDETISIVTELPAPYFVMVHQFAWNPLDPVAIESTSKLIPLPDIQDGSAMAEGKSISANLDYPGDIDFYRVPLDEGEKINISASSISIDPLILVGRPGDNTAQLVGDDDTGGGMFGVDAEMSFLAPDSGDYLLIVMDSSGIGTGGYALEIREQYEGAPTPMVPLPTIEPIESEFGNMIAYFGSSLAILHPYDWTPAAVPGIWWDASCENQTAYCVGKDGAVLIILEEKPGDLQISSVDEYLEFLEVVVDMAGGTILSQEAFESESGQQGVVVTVDIGGVFQAKRMVALQDGVVFNATYLAPADQVEVLWPLAEFSFNSLDSYR